MSQHSVVFQMFIDSQRAVLTMQWHQTQTKCIAHARVEWKRSLTAHTRVTDQGQVKSSSFDRPGLRMCRNGHRRNLTAHDRRSHREWTQVKSSSRLDWTLETLERQIRYNWHITLTIIARTGSLYNFENNWRVNKLTFDIDLLSKWDYWRVNFIYKSKK